MAKNEFVKATYLGGKYVHPVNTPTGELFRKHGRSDYGLHQRGDQFDVLLVDVKARPDLFAVVVEEEEAPPANDENLDVGDGAEGDNSNSNTEDDPDTNETHEQEEAPPADDAAATTPKQRGKGGRR